YKDTKKERNRELWNRTKHIRWKLMGIEVDETTGEIISKYPPLKDLTAI
ncbi:hypothetical protein SAMN05444416_1141, partial [Thermoactinomyces sp. DSM 45892]